MKVGKYPMKAKKFSFTVSIVTLFALFTFMLFVFLTLNFYNRGLSQAYELINNKNSEAMTTIADYITSSIHSVNAHLKVISKMSQDSKDITDWASLIQGVMWEQLISDENMASIFLADNNGTFLQARRLPEYALRTINMKNDKENDKWEYKNISFETLKVENRPNNYDPRTRPWYEAITEEKNMNISSPYLFSSTGQPGITVSYGYVDSESNTKKVAAVDFTLDTLSSLLKNKSENMNAQMVIYNKEGTIIATSLDNTQKLTELENIKGDKYKFLHNIEHNQTHKFGEIVTDGIEYIYFISALPTSSDQEWYLASIIDKNSIVSEINKTLYVTIFISCIIIFILYVSTHYLLQKFFIRPIHKLQEKTNDIANYKFDNIDVIDTNIKEFHELSVSMVLMADSIQKYEKNLKNLMDSFIKIIAESIDAKSPYTGGHCERVPLISKLLIKAASDSKEGIFKNFHFTKDEEWREFEIAAWLHDCGKVVTPEYVVDKATKLETIYNRIHEIRTRFEVLHRDCIIDFYKKLLENPSNEEILRYELETSLKKLQDDFAFIAESNVGGEFMSDDKIKRLEDIGQTKWTRYFDDNLGLSQAEILRRGDNIKTTPCDETLLMDKEEHKIPRERFINEQEYKKYGFKIDIPHYAYNNGELYNLRIKRGTLTDEEKIGRAHV